jgi:hypothetical protein
MIKIEIDICSYLDGVLQNSFRVEHDTLDSVDKQDDTIAKSQGSSDFVREVDVTFLKESN